MKKIIQIIMAVLLAMPVIGQKTVQVEDVINKSPGEVLIPVNMLGFISPDTIVGSLTLQIQFDNNLLEFIGTSNVNPSFAGLIIGNPLPNTLKIVYSSTAGAAIDGKLLDLKFKYFGGFTGDFTFNEFYSEVSSPEGTVLIAKVFDNGTITPVASANSITIGSNSAIAGNPVSIPVLMAGAGFNAIKSLTLRIAYDQVKLSYVNFTLPAVSGISAGVANGIITLTWSSLIPVNLSSLQLLQLNFTYLGGGTASVACNPGCIVTGDDGVGIATQFSPGSVIPFGSYTGSLEIEEHNACGDDTLNVPVTVTATNIPANLGAVCIKFSYVQDDSLVYKGYTANQLLNWSVSQAGGTITFILTNSNGINISNGPLLTLKFDYLLGTQQNIEFTAGTFFSDQSGLNKNVELLNGNLTRNVQITQQPVDKTGDLGATVTFSVVASCAISYQWQANTGAGQTWENITFPTAQTPDFTTPPLQAGWDGVQVKCILQPGNISSGIATLHVNPLVVNAKVILLGAYNATTQLMATTLRTKAYFPLAQPYNVAPWLYAGTETVATVPINVVDWILVELRTGTAASSMVDRKVGFLKADGSIVGIDGVNPLAFAARDINNYYVVVRHRNHLAIMSKNPLALSSTSVLYDFTTGVNKAYGTGTTMLTTSDGKNAMILGDVNSSGVSRNGGPPNLNDYNLLTSYTGILQKNEYSSYDVNMDGVARSTGPVSLNDATKLSTTLGIIIFSTQVPN